MTSWVPRYSPVSMTSTVGGEARLMSTVQPSPYLPPVMATPPAGCTETLDQFLPNMPSPLGESSQYPGQEDMTGEPAMGRQADQVGGPDWPWGVRPIKSVALTYREKDLMTCMMCHQNQDSLPWF